MGKKNVRHKVLVSDTIYKKQDIKVCVIFSFWQYYIGSGKSGNLEIFEMSTKANQFI